MTLLRSTGFATLVVLLSTPFIVFGNDWPQFQGSRSAGQTEYRIPLQWDAPDAIAWTVDIEGEGQSSPVIFGKRVFLTSISGAKKERCHIACYEIATGKKLWRHDFDSATQVENSNYVSKAAPTPVVDADGLVCFFEGGNLLSLRHDGTVRWERNLVREFGLIESRHGLAASLEQTSDRVFVWVERSSEPYVLAVEKATGKDIWKSPGLGVTSWSSPRLVPVKSQTHLVLSGSGAIMGLNPESGQSLWRFEGIKGNSTPTPQPLGEGRFLIGASTGRGETDSGKAAESNGVISIEPQADGTFRVDFLWKAKRATSSFGSPIAHQGKAYFVNATGVLFCLNLETGAELFSNRIADSIWATPLVASNGICFFGKSGKASIVSNGAVFELLSQTGLPEAVKEQVVGQQPNRGDFGSGPTVYAVALAEDCLLIRFGQKLYCLHAEMKR